MKSQFLRIANLPWFIRHLKINEPQMNKECHRDCGSCENVTFLSCVRFHANSSNAIISNYLTKEQVSVTKKGGGRTSEISVRVTVF
jgi:hypothetical protein